MKDDVSCTTVMFSNKKEPCAFAILALPASATELVLPQSALFSRFSLEIKQNFQKR